MERLTGALVAAATLVAATVVAAQAAPRAATPFAPFAFSLDLRTGTFTAASQSAGAGDVSYRGFDVIVDGKSIALPHPVEGAAAAPDGRLVAAVTWDTGGCGSPPSPLCGDFAIWLMNRDGSGLHRFSANARDPAWSPDSRRLAFVGSFDTASLSGIVTVANVDGTHGRALGGREVAVQPEWAPDGTLLAYRRTPARAQASLRVVRVADDRVVAVLVGGRSPAWSRAGHRLAYIRGLRARDSLRVWAGGRTRLVTTTAHGMTMPTWSSNGRRIAFARDGAAALVGVARADGGGARTFRLPRSDARNGAEITDIEWAGPKELLVAGGLYGIFPR
jgi:dipeptidyl aminopeptidase/acylaminoacyl peptidase